MAYGVLSHGLLSKERIDKMKKRFPQFPASGMEKNLPLIEALHEIAEEKQITMPQLLAAWVLSQGEDILALVGARKMSQLQESMKALDVNLSKSDLKRINDVIPANAVDDYDMTFKFKNGMLVR